ncbi:hypothetical protein F2Q69_00021572 [Brassica cretica]|uniref:Uncharacterized protein n=1 Tax=Brassica cretica TaxID=69181 RepID=A0A8S9PZ33_BRACR|nr:hypothetical protein F2Q69_00021572 [Brassica cretica]
MFRALGATLPERHRQVALTCLTRATLPERRGEVARVFIAGRHESDLTRATQRSRSRFHRWEARERPYQSDVEKSLAFSSLGDTRATQSDVSQRPLQVTPEA